MINIFYKFNYSGSGGGGNQFLLLLKQGLKSNNLYTENPYKSKFLLININPDNLRISRLIYLLSIIILNPKCKLFLRVDGKVSLYRDKGFFYDFLIENIFFKISDGIIFQSKWSKNLYKKQKNSTVILNQANYKIYKKAHFSYNYSEVFKIIFTSWSPNKNKGITFLNLLDKKLDFNTFQVTAIGNLNQKFKNIVLKNKMTQNELNEGLIDSHLYLFLSVNETCSNALLEAKATGIPCLTLNSGGNSEIITDKSLLFDSDNELINKIDLIRTNYKKYTSETINKARKNDVWLNYYSFMHSSCKTNILLKTFYLIIYIIVFPLIKTSNFFKI